MSPCGCAADQAAAELLNHLWYDPDWEYAAPAALAMHPQRDHVLKTLIRHVTRSDRLPADLAVDRWLPGDPPLPGLDSARVGRRRLAA